MCYGAATLCPFAYEFIVSIFYVLLHDGGFTKTLVQTKVDLTFDHPLFQ